MPAKLLAVVALCGAHPTPAAAPAWIYHPVPTQRQLTGLSPDEANDLIAKLEEAQARLRASDKLYFHLLAGSLASYDEATTSPRQTFLDIPFRQVWDIQRTNRDSPQRFKLGYSPKGLGQAYWEIEVILSSFGLERVTLLFRPPAPF